jgi:nitrogen fixation NifU-like protein
MRSDLEALYHDVVLDHAKRPRNFRALAGGAQAEGHNPLCGDRFTVYVRIENGVIEDAAFQGYGCAIATASASLMTESLRRRTLADAEALAERFERMMSAPADAPVDDLESLTALASVRRFPVRIKCATLPWQAFRAAARGQASSVSTR